MMDRDRAVAPAPDQQQSLKRYLKEIARLPLITGEEEKRLARRIQDGDQQALKRLVESNLRFVVSYAKRYRGCGLSFSDLINEGNIGLIEAAKRFDAEREVRFITYAVWWIRQSMIHALSNQSGAFRLPQRQAHLLYRIERARVRLQSDLHRPPTTEEIAEHVQAALDDVIRLLQVSGDNLSLSETQQGETEFSLADKVPQESVPAADLVFLRGSLAPLVQNALGELDAKEEQVLKLRFGIDGAEPKTLKEIGAILHLSRERIRQIEARALEKLNRSHKCQQLRGYLN